MNFNPRLSNWYWSFRDRKLVKKFSSKPEGHFLYLPRQTKKMFVDIYIKAGALSEKEEQAGIGHLLEHYLATLANKNLPTGVTFDAKINDYYIVFYFESEDKEALADSIRTFLRILENPDFSHQEIFDYEKKSIINELEREKNDTELKLERLVEKTRYVDEPNGRSFVDHLQRLEDFRIEAIATHHKKIFTKENLEILVSASKPDSKIFNAINDALSELHLPEGSLSFPKPTYSGFQMQFWREPGVSGNYIVMTFPSISRSSSLRDRIVFALMVEIMQDKDKRGLWQEIRKAGIYDLKITYSQGIYNGYLAMQSHVSKEQVGLWIEIIRSMIGELKGGKFDQLLFKKTKEKRVEDLLASWRTNEGRFNFLSDYILNHEDILSSMAVENIIESVSEDDICTMAQRICERGRMNLILFGEDIGFNQEKIKQTLIF